MIAYPSAIPLPLQSLSGGVETPVVRTDMPLGLIKQEGRYATARTQYNLDWTFTTDQLTDFEAWFTDDLAGGVLLFELMLHNGGTSELCPVRFVGGVYKIRNGEQGTHKVQATVERLTVEDSPAGRTPPVCSFHRLGIDPTTTQTLDLFHRNALFALRVAEGNTVTLSIPPPSDAGDYIYFGVQTLGAGAVLITSDGVDPIPSEAAPDFPVTLPAPERFVGATVEQLVARLEMDSGHPRQISMSDIPVKQYDLSWEFSMVELDVFRLFFFEDLNSGSQSFWIPLEVDGGWNTVKVKPVLGSYSERYVAHNRIEVSMRVDRVVDQLVNFTNIKHHPAYYSPSVTLTDSIELGEADDGKMYVCDPTLGETIHIHVPGTLELEIGITVIGLGNVRIARGHELTGTAFPGNTITSTGASQWYVDGVAVSGETGSTYVVRLDDIGRVIDQLGSVNSKTCWSPADISAVAGFWTPYRNVYSSVGPNVDAAHDDVVERWVDIKNGIQLNTNGAHTPKYKTSGTHPHVYLDTDRMDFSDLTVFQNKSYGDMFFSGKIVSISSSSSQCCPISFKTTSTSYFRLAIITRYLSSNCFRAKTHPLDNSTGVITNDIGSVTGGGIVLGATAEWFTGGQLTTSVNNVVQETIATGATGNTPNTASAEAAIGVSPSFGTTYVSGEYRCICLVNAALTSTDRSKIARYMGLFAGLDIPLV